MMQWFSRDIWSPDVGDKSAHKRLNLVDKIVLALAIQMSCFVH
jgi:hypothetical protein